MVKVWYSVKEAARFLGVGVRTIHRLIKSDNPIPYCRIGKQIRFNISDLEAWMFFKKPYRRLSKRERNQLKDRLEFIHE
jgi:excisionase family DNA binding protein